MKKPAPFGWPKRDSQRYRFALPNQIWELPLRPVELMILAYLCYRHHNQGAEDMDAKVIASNVGKCVRTVKTCLSALAAKGAIVSATDLTPTFPLEQQAYYFTLPNEIFLLSLPPSAFAVYAYLLRCEDRETHQCYPSLATIAANTHMVVNTAQNAIGTLVDKGLISVKPQKRFKGGMKLQDNNLYTILPVSNAVDALLVQQMREAEFEVRRQKMLKKLEERCPPILCDVPGTPPPAV